jgi:hypothetical protein
MSPGNVAGAAPGPDPVARVLLALAVLLHVGLIAYFVDPGLLTSGEPVLTYDYALHVYQVQRAVEAFETWGKLWSYDPFVLAGQPAGVVEDLTSKSAILFAIAAGRLGVPLGTAMNLYVLLGHLAVPAAAWASARLFDLSRRLAALAVLSWVLLWHFDSLLHWCWYVGMISWAMASTLSVLVVALCYRATRSHRPAPYAALAVAAAALCLIHPFAVLTVAPPLAVVYAQAARRLPWREHAALWLGVLLAASTTLVWIGPALRFRHYIGDVDAFLRPTLPYALYDALDLLRDILMTGQPVRTLLRTVFFAAGLVGIVRLRRARDPRAPVFATLVLFGIAFGYLGGWFRLTWQTQPYRQLAPAMLAATLPALLLLDALARERVVTNLPRPVRGLLFALALVAAGRFAQTVLQFLPTLLPARAVYAGLAHDPPVPPLPPDELPLAVLGHAGAPPAHRDVRTALEAQHGGRGRVVVLDWALGEYLAAFTKLPLLGGIAERNVPHADAHPLRHDLTPRAPGDDPVARYLETYAVGWVVFSGEVHPLELRADLLEPAGRFGPHRLARTRREPSYVALGAADSIGQALNTITVRGARGPELVLRFHWMETLRCRPGCNIRRVPVPGDRVGFIAIPDPPASLVIESRYD